MKREKYAALVTERKNCRTCIGLTNPAVAGSPAYDSDEIGPWTRLHGDLDADIMVVGQDWGDVRYFNTNRGLDDLRNPTMRTLEILLRSIGVDVSLGEYGQGPKGVFLTNAILCLKDGGLQAKVDKAWFTNCGTVFLRHQIEIVSPKVVVALGEQAYKAICFAFSLKPMQFKSAVTNDPPTILPCGTKLLPMYHCGARILNTHRRLDQQRVDWQRVKTALDGDAP